MGRVSECCGRDQQVLWEGPDYIIGVGRGQCCGRGHAVGLVSDSSVWAGSIILWAESECWTGW